MRMNKKYLIALILIGIIILAFAVSFSGLSGFSIFPNKDKSISGNIIKLNDIDKIKLQGKNISNKITGEVISKRTYNSQTYSERYMSFPKYSTTKWENIKVVDYMQMLIILTLQ